MKAIKLDIFMERAHFRDPQILNEDIIPSLPLPPPTTIAGMLTHLRGERFNEPIDISVSGSYEYISTDFQRVETAEWFEKYIKELNINSLNNISHTNLKFIKDNMVHLPSIKEKIKELKKYPIYIEAAQTDNSILQITASQFDFIKKAKINNLIKDLIKLQNSESFADFKKRKKLQGVSTFEILNNLTLEIFIKIKDQGTLQSLFVSLKDPPTYPALGRKEDYADIRSAEIVEIDENVNLEIEEAIEKDLRLFNTYVPYNIKAENKFNSRIAEIGTLFIIPKIYESLTAQKHERKILHHHYMFVGNDAPYIEGTFCKYKNRLFKWLVNIED